MAVTLYKRNAICTAGVVLKSGTGGSSPPLDENPDWPTSNTLVGDRASFWRAQAGGLGPAGGVYQFDYDFGSTVTMGSAGWTATRFYPPSVQANPPAVEVYASASYPPGSAMSLGLFLQQDDQLKDFGPFSGRYWRVQVTATDLSSNPLEISGNPWLVFSSDIIALKDPSPGSSIQNAALFDEKRTSGSVFRTPIAGQIRGFRSRQHELRHDIDDGTVITYLRDTLAAMDQRFIIKDYENSYLETSLQDAEADWNRLTTGTYRTLYRLAAVA